MTEKRKPGRPSALTPEVQDKIVQALRAGNYREPAARYAGISQSTLYAWLAKGEDPNAARQYLEFSEAVKEAEATAEIHAVATIRQQMTSNWTAAMTFLERRHPDRWRRRDVREITGPDGGPVRIEAPPDAAERALRASELLQRAGALNGSSNGASNGSGH